MANSKTSNTSTTLPTADEIVGNLLHLAGSEAFGTETSITKLLSKSKDIANRNTETKTLNSVPSIFDASELITNNNGMVLAKFYLVATFHSDPKKYAQRLLDVYNDSSSHFKTLDQIPLDLVGAFMDYATKSIIFAVPFYSLKIGLNEAIAHGVTIVAEKPKKVSVTMFKTLPLHQSLKLARRLFVSAIDVPAGSNDKVCNQALIDKMVNGNSIIEINGCHFPVLPTWFYFQSVPVVKDILQSRQVKKPKTPTCSSKLQDDDDDDDDELAKTDDDTEDNPLTVLHNDPASAYSSSVLKVAPKEVKKGSAIEPPSGKKVTPPSPGPAVNTKRARVETPESDTAEKKGKGKGKGKTAASTPSSAGAVTIMTPDDEFTRDNVLKWLGEHYLAIVTPTDYDPKKSFPASHKTSAVLNTVISELFPKHDPKKGMRIHEYATLLVLIGSQNSKVMESYLTPLAGQLEEPKSEYGKMLFGAYPPGVTPDQVKRQLEEMMDEPDYIDADGNLLIQGERQYGATIRAASGAVMGVMAQVFDFMAEKVLPVAQQRTALFKELHELRDSSNAKIKKLEAELSAVQSDLAKTRSDLDTKVEEVTKLEEVKTALDAQIKKLKTAPIAKKPAISSSEF